MDLNWSNAPLSCACSMVDSRRKDEISSKESLTRSSASDCAAWAFRKSASIDAQRRSASSTLASDPAVCDDASSRLCCCVRSKARAWSSPFLFSSASKASKREIRAALSAEATAGRTTPKLLRRARLDSSSAPLKRCRSKAAWAESTCRQSSSSCAIAICSAICCFSRACFSSAAACFSSAALCASRRSAAALCAASCSSRREASRRLPSPCASSSCLRRFASSSSAAAEARAPSASSLCTLSSAALALASVSDCLFSSSEICLRRASPSASKLFATPSAASALSTAASPRARRSFWEASARLPSCSLSTAFASASSRADVSEPSKASHFCCFV
mmetsp:Transcript_75170/g.189205  ORF Transcript_75170/g.189205 Transcript_75170/m.189205 type:complete len:334 (+) Transcript_75170:109-1110(+)